jgi:hypothetical protein
MLHITNLRTVAIGISGLGLAAAGIAVSLGGDSTGSGPAGAGTSAGRTANAQADTSTLDTFPAMRTTLDGTSVDTAFDSPSADTRTDDRRPTRITTDTPRTTPADLPTPSQPKPLLSADIEGPVTVHVTTDDVVTTVGSTVSSTLKTVHNTVSWAKTTVDRTVQSLPVKATVTTGKGGTDVTVSAAGTSASAHIQH